MPEAIIEELIWAGCVAVLVGVMIFIGIGVDDVLRSED
jgi:hypothetical protein